MIHVESTGVAFYHKGSLFIQGIFRDITERKRAEEGLRESEAEARRLAQENAAMAAIGRIISSTLNIEEVYERFAEEVRKLIPSDSIAINIIHDLENTITVPYVSGISVPGYQPGDVVPLAGSVTGEVMRTRSGLMIQAVARDELQARFPTLLSAWDAGLRSLIVVPLLSQDRVIGAIHFRSVKSNAYSDQDRRLAESIASQIAGAVANAKLFAERKRAEEEIKQTLSLLNATLESTTDGLLVVDRDQKIERCNQKFIQMWRIPGSVIASGDDNRALALVLEQLKDPDGFLAGVRELYSQPTAESYDVIEFKDGRIFERYSQPQRIGEAIVGRVWSFRDVTERRQIEKERQRLEERLRRAEKMEALGTLAGGVAHDLNNVLGVLVGYSELLLMEIPEGNPLRTHASNILQSGQRTAAIIQDLLTLARRGVAVSEVVNLNHVIFNYFNSPEFEKLKAYHPWVTFKHDFDKDLLNVKGSPVHLSKTIMNLLSNAAEAISDRGEVTVQTENRYLDKPIAGYEDIKEGDYVVLSVSDNGKGISREDLGKIFEPFYTKKVMGRSGTGLGLAVVWGTMKDHGGYIDVRSEEGKGSTFTLYIPVTREEMVSDREVVRAESYMGRGESILVVDDVKEQRELATTMLSKLGYRVRAASGGEEALTVLQTNRVDLLVLDMIMAHGMDGLETYRRALELNPRQKAIIVSGFSETDRVKTAQVLGAGTYVRKPYVLEKIGLAIRKELDK
jgi:signal transduction histidine kinase